MDDLEKDKLKDNDDKPLEDIKEKSSILTQLKDEICSVQYISLGVWYWIGSGLFIDGHVTAELYFEVSISCAVHQVMNHQKETD